jgi:ABC-2 type transport system permease protein
MKTFIMAESTTATVPRPLPAHAPLLLDQVLYQLRLLVRTPRTLVSGMFVPVLLLVLRGSNQAHPSAVDIAGLVVLGVTMTAYITHAAGLVAIREAGVLRRWRATPLPAWCYFAGRLVATVVIAASCGAVTVLAGVLFYGFQLSFTTVVPLAVYLILGALAWASIGTAVTAFIPSTESAFAMLAAGYLPIVFLSGAMGSTTVGPDWVPAVMRYFPAQPITDGIARALQVTSSGSLAFSGHDLAVLTAWALAGLLASIRWFRWDPRRMMERRPGRTTRHPASSA